jgi:hypothetical protein
VPIYYWLISHPIEVASLVVVVLIVRALFNLSPGRRER